MPRFLARSRIDASAGSLRAWHARRGALARLSPPWERVEIAHEADALEGGAEAVFTVRLGPLQRRWVARHEAIPDGFMDVQAQGPFRVWRHRHTFLPEGPDHAWLQDEIEWSLPGGRLADALARPLVEARLGRMFRYRHALSAREAGVVEPSQTIGITGSHGMIGSALRATLEGRGHRIVPLRRSGFEPSDVEPLDAVVHLAGESIAQRWTEARKREIMASRVEGTRALAQAIARADPRPQTLVTASAIGWYGDAGETQVDESTPRGSGFLADVVEAWEAATQPAKDAGVRVVNTRFGIVLSPQGGALKELLLPTRLGVGGPIGSGRQWWSWVDLDDVVGAIAFALQTPSVEGPVLVVAPHPTRNRDFARTLGHVAHRPSLMPLPAFAARAMLGNMADEMLLASTRATPAKLEAAGYHFAYPDLEGSLRHQLGR